MPMRPRTPRPVGTHATSSAEWPSEWLSVASAARFADVSRRTMEKWIAENRVTSGKVGGCRRVNRRSLELLLERGWSP